MMCATTCYEADSNLVCYPDPPWGRGALAVSRLWVDAGECPSVGLLRSENGFKHRVGDEVYKIDARPLHVVVKRR
jgi:hypothetical protein